MPFGRSSHTPLAHKSLQISRTTLCILPALDNQCEINLAYIRRFLSLSTICTRLPHHLIYMCWMDATVSDSHLFHELFHTLLWIKKTRTGTAGGKKNITDSVFQFRFVWDHQHPLHDNRSYDFQSTLIWLAAIRWMFHSRWTTVRSLWNKK